MAEFPLRGRASGSPLDTGIEQDDLVLVRAVSQHGDERAFRTLYRRHTPRLLSVARRVMGNELDAEDVVQETWMRAVHSMNDFRGESQLSTWLFGIGIHVAQTALRRQKRWIEDYDT